MEKPGDSLQDYWRKLTEQNYEAGYIVSLPVKMPAGGPEIRSEIIEMREDLLRMGIEPIEFPDDVFKFIIGD